MTLLVWILLAVAALIVLACVAALRSAQQLQRDADAYYHLSRGQRDISFDRERLGA